MTEQTVFPCPVCASRFGAIHDFRNHATKQHGVSVQDPKFWPDLTVQEMIHLQSIRWAIQAGFRSVSEDI